MRMKFTQPLVLAVLGALLGTVPAVAHHAFEAEFSQDKHITVTGVLAKVDWVNPHVYVYLDSKDEGGQVIHWQFESVTPLLLHRGGLQRSMLVSGQTYTIDGYGAKDGTKNLGFMKTLHMPDGRTLEIVRPEEK
jgi:hypothetical protein